MSLAELLAAGRLAAANKEWMVAAAWFEDAVNVAPHDPAVRAEWEAVRLYLPAAPAAAGPPIANAATVRGNRGEASYKAYRAALEVGRWKEALDHLHQAVRLDPARFPPFPFSRYTPEAILGAGGFGCVFLCQSQQGNPGQRVVVKVLFSEGSGRSAVEVFREAEALQRLDHPNILRLRECAFGGKEPDRPFMVLDYFEGMSLRDVIRARGPMPPGPFLSLATLLAETLRAAHEQGVIHRDVKPSNILLRQNGGGSGGFEMKLIDFGIAVYPREPGVHGRAPTTTAGSGTPDYAAPEQMGTLSGVRIGTYSDVYGFGRTCYFALLGTPVPDDFEKQDLPEAWQALLRECTARKPERRLTSFAAVLARLQAMAGTQDRSRPAR
jgi:serine/threonine protein kinase